MLIIDPDGNVFDDGRKVLSLAELLPNDDGRWPINRDALFAAAPACGVWENCSEENCCVGMESSLDLDMEEYDPDRVLEETMAPD